MTNTERLNIGIVQMNIVKGNIEANEERSLVLMKKAVLAGADVLVLPELWNMGYALDSLPNLAQSFKDSSIGNLKKFAVENKVNIIGGSIGEKKEGKFYNTLPYINNKGEVVAKYRKIHLFNPELKEDEYFQSGDEWTIAELGGFTAGFMLCYDLRFPELCRNLVLRGANLLFVPAQWPQIRKDDWLTLLKARAIENQAYVVAVNEGTYGSSCVISPFGKVLSFCGGGEQIAVAEIDLNTVKDVRARISIFDDRKNILDEIDNVFV